MSRWGRYGRGATRSDELLKLDLADLGRWGVLTPGSRGQLTWSHSGVAHSTVSYEVSAEAITLVYLVRPVGGSGDARVSIREALAFAETHQPFGGVRRWLICPGCHERRRVLWCGARFRCLRCHDGVHESQYGRFHVGGLARAQRIRERLGGAPDLFSSFPDKPKRMHWRTYRRLEAEERVMLHRLGGALSAKL